MKVLYITRGLGDYVAELVNSMSSHCEAHIILAKNDEWLRNILNPNVKVFTSGAPRVSSLGNLVGLSRMVRYVQTVKPDVIHVQSGAIWELGLAHIFPHIPLVVTIHDVFKHPSRNKKQWSGQISQDHLGNQADAIIVHGKHLRELAMQRYGRRKQPNQIYSIPHGVISRYGCGAARTDVSDDGHVLLFGGLDQWKGIEYFVQAEPYIRERLPHVKLCIAGHSSDPDYYRSLVGAMSPIELRLGFQSPEEVRRLFEWADVLALPYIEASQSGVLQIGFAFTVPPVVTSVGGLVDVIRHEHNGLVVPPREPQQLAKAILRLLSDKKLRSSVITTMTDEKTKVYGWHHIANQTMMVYQSVLAASRSSRSNVSRASVN